MKEKEKHNIYLLWKNIMFYVRQFFTNYAQITIIYK